MNKKVLVIGFGMIGRPLCSALLQNGWEVAYFITSRGIFRFQAQGFQGFVAELDGYKRILDEVSVVCIAISSKDNGELEYGYMLPALKRDKFVVTCAKRALANYFDLFPYAERRDAPHLGLDATVGGNSGILQHLRNRLNPLLSIEAHIVLNASMNCFMFALKEGDGTPVTAMAEVQRRGLAEPGKSNGDFEPFFTGEIEDTKYKTAILVNYCRLLAHTRLRARDIQNTRHLGDRELSQLFRERNRRYIVSLFSEEAPDEDVIGGFTHRINEGDRTLTISAGFKPIHCEPYAHVLVPGAHNAAYTIEGKSGLHGTSYVEGVGAGPGPTVAAMIQNLYRLAAS